MFRPTPGELIGGISRSLRETVLPELPPGAGVRQLRAALHALNRVQRTWDLLPGGLADDNADIEATIAAIIASLASESAEVNAAFAAADRFSEDSGVETLAASGVNAPTLAGLMAINRQLQSRLIGLDAWLRGAEEKQPNTYGPLCRKIDALYGRMVDRELATWGSAEVFEDAFSSAPGERRQGGQPFAEV
jgi:hypothetical protein